jgi:hypothetical protein
MPAFAADYLGSKTFDSIYGLLLSAFGPILVSHMRQVTGQYGGALDIHLRRCCWSIVPALGGSVRKSSNAHASLRVGILG